MASTSPLKYQENMSKLANATAAFAVDLYHALGKDNEGQNVLFSPLSINMALAMTLNGARGNTADQMKTVLQFQAMEEADIHATFAELDALLQTNSKSGYILKIANRIFANKNYTIRPGFMAATRDYYNAESLLMDFAGDTEGSRELINNWVMNQTNDKIENLIEAGGLDHLTVMLLVNAVYFKGDWLEKFDTKNTKKAPFWIDPNKNVNVDLMFQRGKYMIGYNKNLRVQVLELPYVKNEIAMTLLIPERFKLKELEEKLTPDILLNLLTDLQEVEVLAYMPRFKLSQQVILSDKLRSLGMTDLFDESKADLSGIDSAQHLHVTELVHKTHIEVNEEGSEAAASSAVMVSLMSLPPEFRADKPFMFVIRDIRSNIVLFMGRVSNPTV